MKAPVGAFFNEFLYRFGHLLLSSFLCMMDRFRNIIFDLGGVLLDIDYQRVLKAFHDLGISDFDPLYKNGEVRDLFQSLEGGLIPLAQFYDQFNSLTGKDLTSEQFDEAWNMMLVGFRQSSLDYLNKLRDQADLYLLSNTNVIHRTAFREMYKQADNKNSFEENFKKCFYSFELGKIKPDVACFQLTLERAGIKAMDTIFIDDTLQNIEGAQNAGIKSLLLRPDMRVENLGLEKILSGV